MLHNISDPMLLGLSRDWWSVIGIIGTVLAAFGTLAAVVVSLWLAYKAMVPRVLFKAEYRHVLDYNRTGLEYEVTNTGSDSITITQLGLEVLASRKWSIYASWPDLRYHGVSSEFPIMLLPSEQASWFIGLEEPTEFLKIVRRSEKKPRRLRCWIRLSNGKIVRCPAPSETVRMLHEAYERKFELIAEETQRTADAGQSEGNE